MDQVESKGKILVVDDSATVRTSIRSILERGGYSVIDVPDGKQAIEVYAEEDIQLITLDVE
ncbi:MAG: response regulator, partial [Bdellovibrionales bacterium]|nr:response regulator [Bdellovibrionales bacterium]